MDLVELRSIVLIAVFSVDDLFDMLALKGGNALELVHKVISRGSVDIDLSMSGDFDDVPAIKQKPFMSSSTVLTRLDIRSST